VTPWYKEPTRAQWATYIACWSGWVLDAFDFTIFFLAMPLIALEFGVSTEAVAGSITLTLLVRLVGGGVAGWAADRWGRRLPLMLSILWFALCDGAIAFAPSFTAVVVLRTLFGFGMGGEWAVGTTMAMENWPERTRGLASGALQGSWAIGYLLASGASALIVPLYGWRALFLLGVAPALLVLFIRFFVPADKVEPRATKTAGTWRTLLEHKKSMAFATASMVLGFSVYYGLTALYPTMLYTELGMDASGISWLVALFNIGMLGGAVLCGWLASRFGLSLAVAVPSLLAVLALPLYVGWVPGGLAMGAFLAGAVGVGWSGVVPAFLTSLFPSHVRSFAVGLVYHLGAFAAAFIPTIVAVLGAEMGLNTAIAMVSGAALVSLAILMGLPALFGAPAVSGQVASTSELA
jgi:MFS transporter, SHS family, lactate transporter